MADITLVNGLYAAPIILGSALSLIACSIIFATHRTYEELRRHPNGIVIVRSLFDCLFAVSAIVESSVRANGHGPSSANCQAFSFLNQVAIPGSELCFMALSYDLYTALHNPFVDYKQSLRRYVSITILVSIVMAAILVGVNTTGGDPIYGITNFGLCWVTVNDTANSYMWAFFYWIIISTYAFAMFVLFDARRRLSKGLRETYEARMTTFRHGVAFLIGYAVFWTVVAIVYWSALGTAVTGKLSPAMWIFSLLFCSRGVATMSVWLWNHNLREVAREEAARARVGSSKLGKVNRQLQPSLNLALRKEILHYTTLAIRLSVVQSAGEEAVSSMLREMKTQLARRARSAGAGGRRDDGDAKQGPSGGGADGQRYTLPSSMGSEASAAGTGMTGTSPAPPRGAGVTGGGGAALVNPAAVAIAAAAHKAAVSASSFGGAMHDLDVLLERASRLAPHNDTKRQISDASLSTEWRALNIALYAPMFERGGLYDLGEFTASSSSGGKDGGKRASVAPDSVAATSAAAASAAGKHDGAPPGGDVPLTPTSVDDVTGEIHRPPLELYDLAPDVFARIRDLSCITPAQFLFSLSRTTKERFSEGASGAFMCFSHDMRFVIKTMEKDEADVLQRILPAYLQHLRNYEETLVIKFYACMSLRLYRQTMYFVVMENIFPTKVSIHERFDLKGSWVGRSAGKGVPGTIAYCRFCNERFRVGSSEMCPAKPNRRHVVNTVLKDNDLTFKLRFAPERAQQLGAQLRADTDFLIQMGVMDYSLLVGVHNRKFRIENELPQSMASSTASSAMQATAAAANARWSALLHGGASGVGAPAQTAPPLIMATMEELRSPTSSSAVSRRSLVTGVRFAAEVSELGGDEADTPVARGRAAGGFAFAPRPPSPLRTASAGPRGRPPTDTEDSIDFDLSDASLGTSGAPPDALSLSRQGTSMSSLTVMRNPLQAGGAAADAQSTGAHVPFFRRDEGGMASSIIEGPGVFYIGIIDILQEWNLVKRAERWMKAYFMCMDIHGISVAPPDEYGLRFEQRVIGEVIERDTSVHTVAGSIPANRRMSLAPRAMSITARSSLAAYASPAATAAGAARARAGGLPLAIAVPMSTRQLPTASVPPPIAQSVRTLNALPPSTRARSVGSVASSNASTGGRSPALTAIAEHGTAEEVAERALGLRLPGGGKQRGKGGVRSPF